MNARTNTVNPDKRWTEQSPRKESTGKVPRDLS